MGVELLDNVRENWLRSKSKVDLLSIRSKREIRQ
jgi:hypothetical protein